MTLPDARGHHDIRHQLPGLLPGWRRTARDDKTASSSVHSRATARQAVRARVGYSLGNAGGCEAGPCACRRAIWAACGCVRWNTSAPTSVDFQSSPGFVSVVNSHSAMIFSSPLTTWYCTDQVVTEWLLRAAFSHKTAQPSAVEPVCPVTRSAQPTRIATCGIAYRRPVVTSNVAVMIDVQVHLRAEFIIPVSNNAHYSPPLYCEGEGT
jgi:hypothetical protein